MHSLPRQDTIAERGELLILREVVPRMGNPPLRQAHEPLHELRRGSRTGLTAQNRGQRSGTASDFLPQGYCSGVSSPASKSSPINVHRLSGSSARG